MPGWPPPAYFSIPRQGWGGHLREKGRGRRKQGVRLAAGHRVSGCGGRGPTASSAASPQEGFGNPAHSSHRCLLSHVALCPESCPAITNGALCSRDKERTPHPQPGPGVCPPCPQPWPQKGWCHFQEGKLRSGGADSSVEPEEGSVPGLGSEV